MTEYFLTLSLILIPMMYSPGPTNILLASMGASYGLRQSIPLIVGINIGIGVQLVVIMMGITSFFATHPKLFAVLHYAGVAYMFWLAYSFLKAPHQMESEINIPTKKTTRAVFDGIFIEILNPKVWISLMVVFAMFARDFAELAHATAIFSTYAVILNLADNILWAIFGAFIIRRLCQGPLMRFQNLFFGGMLAAVGVWMLLNVSDLSIVST